MAYDDITDRVAADGLIPEDYVREIFDQVEQTSVIGSLARRLRNGTTNQQTLPVLSSLPTAYFVDGEQPDGAAPRKQTTASAWEKVNVNYGEIAVIAPVPENVFDDATFPIWDELSPHLIGAIGSVFDRGVLYKEGAPATWPTSLIDQIAAAGHAVVQGSVGDLFDDLLAEGGVFNKVEEDGYMVTGSLAHNAMKAKLRGLRTQDGDLIFSQTVQGLNTYALDGEQILFARNGSVDKAEVLLVSGQWDQLVWSVRQDVTFKLLDQAVITDDQNNIVYNLAQDDMVALRVKFRAGWALPNPPTRENTDEATRLPFAALLPTTTQYSG